MRLANCCFQSKFNFERFADDGAAKRFLLRLPCIDPIAM